MNKKAQFFLIAAVIVCVMIFSVTRVFTPSPTSTPERYYALYTSIKNACMDTVAYSDDPIADLERVEEELYEFCKEANVTLLLDYSVNGSTVEVDLKLVAPGVIIEDPFKIVISKMNVKIEDLLQDTLMVKGNIVDNEDFYSHETLYRYSGAFIVPDESGKEFRTERYYTDTLPRIGAYSSLNFAYTPYDIIDDTLSPYDFIVVRELSGIDYEKADHLYEYLKGGRNALFVGMSGRTFVQLLNEKDIYPLGMTKNDFYVDNTEIVTIGKGKVFLRDGGKNRTGGRPFQGRICSPAAQIGNLSQEGEHEG